MNSFCDLIEIYALFSSCEVAEFYQKNSLQVSYVAFQWSVESLSGLSVKEFIYSKRRK